MTKDYTIILPDDIYHEVRNHLVEDPNEEAAAFLLAGIQETDKNVRLLARRVVYISREQYRHKSGYHLDVSPQAINGIASLCEVNGLTVILCHSHTPGVRLEYSSSDNHGEARLSKFLSSVTGNKPIGSLLISAQAITGRVWQSNITQPIKSIMTVGEIMRVLSGDDSQQDTIQDSKHSRQVLVLGETGQEQINKLKVGIVGLGGTGSCVAEQLVRLGVSQFLLIDDDMFEDSNVTRMFGTNAGHLSKKVLGLFKRKQIAKVDIISTHLKTINPQVKVESIQGNVVLTPIAQKLLDCDIIMLCTDEHWGRSIVNQISYQYLIPVINMGVRVDAPNGIIQAAAGDVHTIGPGKPCLWCYQFLNSNRINAESMLPEQRQERLREGYVEGLGKAPMVIPFTSTVASLAVTELLHLVTGFREERSIKRLKWDILEGRMWQGRLQEPSKCICKSCLAFGDLKTLPTNDDPDFIVRCRNNI